MACVINKTFCPICTGLDHEKVFPEYHGKCITSQSFYLDDITLSNRICKNCGFIFNAQGIRHKEEAVYNNIVWKPKPQIMAFSGKDIPKTSHQQAFNSFLSLKELPDTGSILDFGAGTGAFLLCFQEAFPKWEITALEPGDGFASLVKNVKLKNSYNLPFYKAPIDEKFDVIVVTSVLEHLTNPLTALEWIKERLSPNGTLLMQHPDFAKLPGDLFCADHINKLTVPYTKALCKYAGFDLVAEDIGSVMFYLALQHGEKGKLPDEFKTSKVIANECASITQSTIEAIEIAVEGAKKTNGNAAIFGSTSIAFMAPLILDCTEDIVCFVDENPHMKGKLIEGVPVVLPEEMQSKKITDVAIATSPLYWEIIANKLRKYNVALHVPKK